VSKFGAVLINFDADGAVDERFKTYNWEDA